MRSFVPWLGVACVAVCALAAPGRGDRAWLIYNHSPSMPTGLYFRLGAPAVLGSIVTVRAVEVSPVQARQRHFDGRDDFFIKRIAAAQGQVVCARGDLLMIDGKQAATRKLQDTAGEPLPRWQGCLSLDADELLLLGDTADSFDGRYWGVISRARIQGVWRRL